jgi:hypothetical protein
MKPWIAISAALAVMSFSHAASADVVYHPFGINPAYQVPSGPLTPFRPYHHHRRHAARYYQPHEWTPVACEAVIFPRSPLCAGRPARFGPYNDWPFTTFVYY